MWPMCFFITVAVPKAKADVLKEAVPRGMHIDPVENRSVSNALPSDYTTYLLCSGGCSCGLYQDEIVIRSEQPDLAKRRIQYEKKGWSDAKIGRALEQSQSSQTPPYEGEEFVGLREDVVGVLAQVAMKVSKLGVLVHWYDGSVESERIPIRQTQQTPIRQFNGHVVDQDCLIWITDKPRRE